MKIKLSSLYGIVLCVLCFALTGLVSSLPIPIINDVGNWRALAFIFSIVALLMYATNPNRMKGTLYSYPKVYSMYTVILMIAMLSQTIFSMHTYGESFLDVLITSQGQYYVLLFPIIIYIFMKDGGIQKLFDALNIVFILVLLIYLFANVLFLYTGRNILGVSMRYGHLRLDPPFFSGILCIYNLWKYNSEKKKFNLLFVIIYLVYLFTMSGTRMEMIATVVALIAELLVFRKGFGKQTILVILIGIGIAVANYKGLFNAIIASFGESSDLSLSTSIRMLALEYFKSFQAIHPWFGMGFVRGGVNSEWDYILYGPTGKYVFSDVGLLGFFYKTGFLSSAIIGIPLLRMVYIYLMYISKKNKAQSNQTIALLTGLLFYLIVCQISLAVTDIQRCLLLPILWGVFEYFWYEKKSCSSQICS